MMETDRTQCSVSGVTLTQAQRKRVSEWFSEHAGDLSYLEPTQVEAVVELCLGTPLTDTILDTVIDLTDGIDTVDEELFLRIMAAVLARTTSWGDLTLQASGIDCVRALVATVLTSLSVSVGTYCKWLWSIDCKTVFICTMLQQRSGPSEKS
eukprot:m.494936 g.494936  ORF g.494936 m.494936 type:complete len:152 (+) comp21797_c0_seq18:331-786(+)